MKNTYASRILQALSVIAIVAFGSGAAGQSSSSDTQALPEVDVHWQLPSHLRVLAFSGLQQGVGYSYQQWYAAAAVGYQFKPILRQHLLNIDRDKEHYFVFGGGYEFLQTSRSGKVTNEDRVVIEGTPGFRLPPEFLLRDRNRVELRWVNGVYSTTYRNQLTVEHDFLFHRFRFTPAGSAEAFYDGAKHSWNQEWYTGGIQFPYKRLLMIDAYYRRENCPTCKPAYWNVGGVTLSLYFGNTD